MFQFGGFPTYTYVFSIRSMVLHHGGFPIRRSAGRSLFAAHRSLSQLVTSFIGSLCQGIHLMLLFAWTFLTFQFSSFELLEFHKQIMISVINSSVKRFYPFFFLNSFSTFRWNCNLPKLERPWFLLISISFNLCPLICSFLTLQYFIRFSMNIYLLTFVSLVGSSGLEPPTSRLSGARSNHLSYEPTLVSVYLVPLHPLVEMMGIEPMTPCLQGRCSPSWATPPYLGVNE